MIIIWKMLADINKPTTTLIGFLYVDYTNCGPSKKYRLQTVVSEGKTHSKG